MKTSNFDFKDAITDNHWASLWYMMKGFRTLYIVAVICLGLAALARTGIYYLLRYFIDEVLVDSALLANLPWIAMGFVALAVVQGLTTFVSGRFAAQTAEGITLRLRDYLYDHIQRLSFTYHDRMQTGELLQRATSDVDALRRLYSEQAIGIGRIVLLFLVNFIALLSLNVELALYSIIVIPIVIMMSLYFFSKVGDVFESFQEQDAVLSNRLQEYLTGIRVVKAFARQAYEEDKFETENWEKYRRSRRLTLMHATYWPVTDILCGMQMLAGFFLGARMAIAGEISAGTYLAYAGMVVLIIWPIRNLGRLVAHLSTGFVSYGRIATILHQQREPLDAGSYIPEDGLKGTVRFTDVSFAYDEATPVLHDIGFAIEPGQAVALIGATGSGKTSLVNLLPRFYDYTDGSITIDDVELREYPRHYLRQQIGIVQQEPFLFSRTIRENITYGVGREVSDEEVEAAARAAAIHDVILSFPDGYKTLVGERGVTLSGGQKQRVTIARTLLKNPCLLILDDATSSVDTETDAVIRGAMYELMQDRTTFIIAHRIQSVMEADLILVLRDGRIVQRGTHDVLSTQSGIYQKIYELQTRIEAELDKEIADLSAYNLESVNGHRQSGLMLELGD